MHRNVKTGLVALLMGVSLMVAEAAQAFLITDPVENNDGWVVTGNSIHFLTACCGTSPTAGSVYLHIQNKAASGPIGGRDASKSFPGNTLVPGSYTVTFDIGNFNNRPFADIDLSQTGLTVNGTVLTPLSSYTPTPSDPGIEKWTLYYEIVPGHPDLGQTLGFRLVAPDTSLDRNASFDNLAIAVIEDDCLNSDLSPTVIIAGCDSGVTNTLFESGCNISDFVTDCAESAADHGQFVSCVAHLTNTLKKSGTITGQQKGAIQSCAAQTDIP